jgi:hypothetical protein
MLDAATTVILAKVLRRESLSVLQYAGQAYPWAQENEHAAVKEIRKLWEEDRECIGDLTRFLAKHRVRPPFIGAFPTNFTTLNFIGVDFVLAKLVADQKRAVADLERDLAAITDAQAQEPILRMLEVKKKHLPILEQLANKQTQPAA